MPFTKVGEFNQSKETKHKHNNDNVAKNIIYTWIASIDKLCYTYPFVVRIPEFDVSRFIFLFEIYIFLIFLFDIFK